MLIRPGIEETSRWTGNKTDAMTVEKALHGVDDKTMVNNDQTQGNTDTLGGDLARTNNVKNVQGALLVQDIGARVIHGAQVILNRSYTILNILYG